jgi:hypothetical protein
MAKPSRSYANLALTKDDPEREEGETQKAHIERIISHRKNTLGRPKRSGLGDDAEQVKSKAHHMMTYVSVDAVKVFKRHALESDQKMSDVVLEALQEWLDRNGYKVTARVRGIGYLAED